MAWDWLIERTGKLLFHSSHGIPGISNRNIWSNGKRPLCQLFCGKTLVSANAVDQTSLFRRQSKFNICGECCFRVQQHSDLLSIEAYTWLIKHLSQEGDAVVDVFSSNGYTIAGYTIAVREDRNALCLSDLQTVNVHP